MKKVVIFSAPSGSGKSTIINHLLTHNLGLEFSVSATSRPPRGSEKHGQEYYFFSQEEFEKKIANDEFLEWEEVYPGCYYGTLKSEIERIWKKGNTVIFDVDVIGGLNIKKIYGQHAFAVFIEPPSIQELEKRLLARGTDSSEKIKERLNKAAYEMSFAQQFDVIIVNDNLDKAEKEAKEKVVAFIQS